MSLELPAKADLASTPTVAQYKAAIGLLYDFLLSGFFDPVVGSGAADVQTATLGETSGYKTNRIYCVRPGFTNTGACTFNFDGLGAKNIKLIDASNPYAGAITAGVPVYFRYDGTNLVLLNPYFVMTAAGRALLDDADAAAQLVTLGAAIAASDAQMRAGSSNAVFTPPGRQHHHPGHPKAWGSVTSGGVLGANYGASSTSKISTGYYEVDLSSTLTSSTYGLILSAVRTTAIIACVFSKSASSFQYKTYDAAGSVSDSAVDFLVLDTDTST